MKIKAAVLREFNKPLTIETLELDDPKEGEVLVKVIACGFCHSDLHVMLGELQVPLPIVLGHEAAGIVEKVGPGVTRVKPGDHVVLTWMVPCGKCFQCLNGRPNLCEGHFDAFVGGTLLDGTSRLRDEKGKEVKQAFFVSGFANYTVVPEYGAHPIRKDVPFEYACLVGCCIPTGAGAAMNVCNIKPGTSVVVFGCGGVGLNAIRGAALRQANPLIAVDLEGDKEEIAREFGATHFINSSKEDPVEKIKEITGGYGAEYIIEAIGDPGAIVQAYWSLRLAGRIILIGITPQGQTTNIDAFLIPFHEKAIIGTLYGGIKPTFDIPYFVDLIASGDLKTEKLVTKKIKLEDVNNAGDMMIKRKILGRWVMMMEH